jgi:hypothetical protein
MNAAHEKCSCHVMTVIRLGQGEGGGIVLTLFFPPQLEVLAVPEANT